MANENNDGNNDVDETISSGIRQGVIGNIKPISGAVPPQDWALCDGSLLAINENPALFALIGARFGGDGVSTFALPDLSGKHHFAICLAGYFPLESALPSEWKAAAEHEEYIDMRVLTYSESYAQGLDPFYHSTHDSELDAEQMQGQAQVMMDAYARGEDPLYRHPHMSEVDAELLERQVQVLKDAHAQGVNPLHSHTHVSHLDPEWLEQQAQVLKDAYARGEDPLHRHTHESELDAEWLERQVQVLNDAHARGEDPLHRHQHVSDLDPDFVEMQAQVLKDAYARGEDPLHRYTHESELDEEQVAGQVQAMQDAYARGEDPLHRHQHMSELDPDLVERQAQVMKDAYTQGHDPLQGHSHVSDVDPEFLEKQVQTIQDAYAQGHDPLTRDPHTSELDEDEELAQRVAEMIAAYERGEDPLADGDAEMTTADADAGADVDDDLKRIEGIGPKISALLQDAGIRTFAQLADSDVERLQQILDDANIRIADPATWPEQAALAAAGKWDELEALQDELKGGRRT